MNYRRYNGDPRYLAVWEKMQLLQIEDVTTKQQEKNGTIVWRLPIKNNWPGNKENSKYIEVASFKTGYVRNQNSAYSNYQLNKCVEGERFYKLSNGDYRKFKTKKRILIPIEIERLEYLIEYCIKNYYIKNANQVANGEFIPKWKYESYKEEYKNRAKEVNDLSWEFDKNDDIQVIINGHRYNLV